MIVCLSLSVKMLKNILSFSFINKNQNQNDDDNSSSNSSSIEQQNKMTNSETDDVTSQQPQERMSEVEVVVQPPTPESNSNKSPVDQKPVVQFTGGSVENVAVVVWEATVTGRRLIDEMINLGAYYAEDDASDEQVADSESNSKEPADDASSQQFNEYVMPYGKLPLNVIRNYNLRIVDTGRYRMLKEIRHNRMLKSKSEVAAVNDLATWLIQLQRTKFPNKKIVLVYFEPRHTKILQLFQAFERFRLLDDIKDILLGCVNAWDLLRQQVHDVRDEHRMVLKALTEHHIGPETPLESAAQRAQALHTILTKVHGGRIEPASLMENLVTSDYLLEQVKKIKEELIKEAQWRPVFADMFRQGLKPRRRAGFLRHLLVESDICYNDVAEMFKDKKEDGVTEMIKDRAKGKNLEKNEADVEELIKLLIQHMSHPELQQRAVRRGSGRKGGQRTRSVCVSELKKMAIKNEENNNDDDPMISGKNSSEIPSAPVLTMAEV